MSYPIYEFILWDNCNNNCQFCFQSKCRQLLSFNEKCQSICTIKQKTATIKEQCNLLFVGGEIFDDVAIKEHLLSLFSNVIHMQKSGIVEFVYFNTNLLYDNLDVVLDVINLFKQNGLLHKVKFTTSYDEVGRFACIQQRELFMKNLSFINDTFNEMPIVVNAILTQPLCTALIDGTSYVYQLLDKCQMVNLLPYVVNDISLMASKNQIFRALLEMERHSPNYISQYVRNMNLDQQRNIFKYEKGNLAFVTEGMSECGHCLNFRKYSNSGSCFICDINGLFGDFI